MLKREAIVKKTVDKERCLIFFKNQRPDMTGADNKKNAKRPPSSSSTDPIWNRIRTEGRGITDITTLTLNSFLNWELTVDSNEDMIYGMICKCIN